MMSEIEGRFQEQGMFAKFCFSLGNLMAFTGELARDLTPAGPEEKKDADRLRSAIETVRRDFLTLCGIDLSQNKEK